LPVEGNSIRATVRMTGAAKNTVAKLLVGLGYACSEYQDRMLRGLNCQRVQCDEIWSFVGCKEKNVPEEKRGTGECGDAWTWTAIDADTKLVVSWYVGDRSGATAAAFMSDVAARLSNRVQLTTDGHSAYLVAVRRPRRCGGLRHAGEDIWQRFRRREAVQPAICLAAQKTR